MEIAVSRADAGQRLDVLLKASFPEHSRARIQQAIKNGHCWLDGRQVLDPALKPAPGQTIRISIEDRQAALAPCPGNLEIVWQDENIAICAKPAGLTVHPCPSCPGETLANQLLARFPQLASQGGERPGIAHRLDRDTSGLIAIGLDEKSRLGLSAMFAERKIHKEYLALVAGEPPAKGECREAIGRHPALKTRMAVLASNRGGKAAHTEWRKLWSNGRFSLLRLVIHSGRTHQIRVHMAHLGYPLLGDRTYAPRPVADMAPRQMLHAARLTFRHPETGEEIDVSLAPPEDFFAAALANCRQLRRIVVTGNQGCGKSSFCRALANLGLPVISADDIVARLYSQESDATYWIRQHLGQEAINPDNSVNKRRLFKILQERPELKRELETAVHGMVECRLEQFWQENADKKAAVAEIPLYFESALPGMQEAAPLVVGVHCPEKTRWRRIAETRGWSQDKIEAIESWQWPEARKMAACDEVIDNSGAEDSLECAASAFIAKLDARQAEENAALLAKFRKLCNAAADLRKT